MISSSFPVELTNFTVSLTNGISVLEWSTASEYNSHYFSIESSEDAIHFKEIGRMNAAGFSTAAQYYSFNDENDVTSGATRIYYRLRMVDTDQTYQYSAVRWVDLDEATVAESITIFPNPVKDLLSVNLYSATEQSASIELTGVTGKLIRNENILLKQGYNFMEINRFDELPDGIYLLKVTAGRNYYTGKVVKD
ncbi:MAG: T9SS type A sorting domain-containing protein [Chitinophagaceae bacterium]|nr:T9SS type A sorting domain-containing protein [Chitinophagaceae bacterium]